MFCFIIYAFKQIPIQSILYLNRIIISSENKNGKFTLHIIAWILGIHLVKNYENKNRRLLCEIGGGIINYWNNK